MAPAGELVELLDGTAQRVERGVQRMQNLEIRVIRAGGTNDATPFGLRITESARGMMAAVANAEMNELDPETYYSLIVQGLKDQGYVKDEMLSDEEVVRWLRNTTSELKSIAGTFEVGTVLERRGGSLSVRERAEQTGR